ncbi:MAG: hypothetical protein ABEJ05_14040 [Haloglomus sp.]
MDQCDRCGGSIVASEEWIEVAHHHAHMTFGSTFCCADCAVAYLQDDLDDGLDSAESEGDSLGV